VIVSFVVSWKCDAFLCDTIMSQSQCNAALLDLLLV
jgi:hypothetical protein